MVQKRDFLLKRGRNNDLPKALILRELWLFEGENKGFEWQ